MRTCAPSLSQRCLDSQKPVLGCIIHIDLGTQYTTEEFAKGCKTTEMIQSFSHKGCRNDNVWLKSFHTILEKEEVHHVNDLADPTANWAKSLYANCSGTEETIRLYIQEFEGEI